MLELLHHVLQGDPSTPLPGRKLSVHFYTCQHPTQCPALLRGSTEKCGVIESGKKGSEHGERVGGKHQRFGGHKNGILWCFREVIMGTERADWMCPGCWDFSTSGEQQEDPPPGNLPNPEIKPESLYISCIGRQALYH